MATHTSVANMPNEIANSTPCDHICVMFKTVPHRKNLQSSVVQKATCAGVTTDKLHGRWVMEDIPAARPVSFSHDADAYLYYCTIVQFQSRSEKLPQFPMRNLALGCCHSGEGWQFA
ncbi:MAG: hypothetical protein U9N87_00810 [Planctomycetota bacterium]|nr:hypothetical protein [Planctomycetota bacterium]